MSRLYQLYPTPHTLCDVFYVVTAHRSDHGHVYRTLIGACHPVACPVHVLRYLPHPFVKEIRVFHPGTIWLGRLDEVDVNLVSSDTMWHSRAKEYFDRTVAPPKAKCPDCVLVHNDQSADLKL